MKNITELKNELLKDAELFNQLKSELSERQEKEFNSLVRLGDSKELALATTIQESDEEYKEKYHAYLNYHRD